MRKLVPSICFLLGGLAVFVLGSPYYAVFPTNGNQLYYVVITVFFLGLSVALRRSPSLSRYGPSAYALFVASAATLTLSTGLLNIRVGTTDPLHALALDKLSQFLHVVPVITSLVFGASHVNATYEFAGGGVVFGIVVFVLGVVGAYSMLKTDGLLGPVLFHAGYDLVIIVPVLNS